MPIQANQMSIHEILEMIFQNKWYFGFCMFLGLFIALVYTEKTEKWYTSRADIQVIDRNSTEPLLRGLGVSTSVASRFNTVRARLLSRNGLEQFAAQIQSENRARLTKNPNEMDMLPFLGNMNSDSAVKSIQSSLNMYVSGGIITLAVERRNPYEAQFIVDKFQSRVLNELMNTRENRLRDTKVVLKNLLDEYDSKLKQSEEFLRDFEVFNQIDLAEKNQKEVIQETASKLQVVNSAPSNLINRYIALSNKIAENDTKMQSLRGRLQNTQEQLKKEPEFSVANFTTEPSETSKQLEVLVAKSEGELAQLRQNRTEEHPLVQEKKEEVRELRKRLAGLGSPVIRQEQRMANPIIGQLKTQTAELTAEISGLVQEQNHLMEEVGVLRERIKTVPNKELEKTRLQRELQIQSSIYQNIRQRYENAELTDKLETEERQIFQILSPATFEATPVRPNKNFIIAMGLFLGMSAGILVCFLLEFTNTTFRNLEDASRFLDLPILGVIPEVEYKPKKSARREMLRRQQTT